eukprot:8523712-Lingulodinium_polyedra.AAC.1
MFSPGSWRWSPRGPEAVASGFGQGQHTVLHSVLPCSSFSQLQRLNGRSARTARHPMGGGELPQSP